MSAPALTVLIPVYNTAAYLATAIESVLCQSYEDFELLLIDDGSTDESMEVARGFRDKRIRIETQPENLGLIATLNRGIDLARGELLARLDADDFAHPERFALQVAYLENNPAVVGVSSAFDLMDDRGTSLPDDYGRARPVPPLALRWGLHFGCFFTHGGAMLRTSVLRDAGGFDPGYEHAEDYELWLRLSRKHQLANIPRTLLTVRIHQANVSKRHRETQRENAYRALQASLEHLLKRSISLEEVRTFRDGTLPASSARSRAQAALHCEVFAALTRAAPRSQTRTLSADLAQRLGVLASRALRPQPAAVLEIARLALRHSARNFIAGFMANRRGAAQIHKLSPLFELAPDSLDQGTLKNRPHSTRLGVSK